MSTRNNLIANIERLIVYWNDQEIAVDKLSPYEIEAFEKWRRIRLPNDFKEYYQRANGMKSYYPNDTDAEGFLFYPLENFISFEDEFMVKPENAGLNRTYIFAEYMHKSWWYGVKLNDMNDTYEIGIIPDKERFKSITTSLVVFIDLYLQDDARLYQYE
ncbi:SMI1/KNR4 family protein [Chitinophaga defluvii]|uniref:SMI1/KNR4 family protein n=1 Tax=Chitinophaga defluvii TaxID=3163343 RepID=A0ABV2TEX3_9BACT